MMWSLLFDVCLVVICCAMEANDVIFTSQEASVTSLTIDQLNCPLDKEITKQGCKTSILNAEHRSYSASQRVSLYAASPLVSPKDSLLRDVIWNITQEELNGCSLVLAFDDVFHDAASLDLLLSMSFFRQVLRVQTSSDFTSLLWESATCGGYIFLLGDSQPLLMFMNEGAMPWNYDGKFIFVGIPRDDHDAIANSKKGKKTQHIIALNQDNDEVVVRMNLLFWGKGMNTVNRWRSPGFTSDSAIFPDKVSNLRGAELTLVTLEIRPHIIREEIDGESNYYGRDIIIANFLGEVMNFSVALTHPAEGEFWGTPQGKNGSWNGLIGILERDEAHFGIACIFITDNGNMTAFVDLSHFYDADKICFVVPVEKPLPRWMSLAAPFHMDTWLTLLIGFLVVSPILFLMAKGSFCIGDEIESLQKIPYSVLWTWGVHMRQSLAQTPWQTATQIWVIFLWLYAIVLTTGYSCNLTAFLTITKTQIGMETIAELHSSGYDIIAYGSYFKVSMEESDNVYLQELSKRFQPLPDMTHTYDLLEDGKSAFISVNAFHEYHISLYFTQRGVPSMRIMKECFTLYYMSAATQKHLPLRKPFDNILMRLFESGLSRKWFLDVIQESKQKVRESQEAASEEEEENGTQEGAIALSLDHLRGIFYILFFGLALSTGIAFVEICIRNT